MQFTKKKIAGIVATTAVVALGATVAVAYWTSTGSGTGSGSTDTSTAFTIATTANTSNTLTPDGPTENIAFTVTNPSSGKQNLASVVVTVDPAWSDTSSTKYVDATATPPCTAADFYSPGTPTFLDRVGPAAVTLAYVMNPAEVIDGTVTLRMKNRAANQNACQGVTVPLLFAAS